MLPLVAFEVESSVKSSPLPVPPVIVSPPAFPVILVIEVDLGTNSVEELFLSGGTNIPAMASSYT